MRRDGTGLSEGAELCIYIHIFSKHMLGRLDVAYGGGSVEQTRWIGGHDVMLCHVMSCHAMPCRADSVCTYARRSWNDIGIDRWIVQQNRTDCPNEAWRAMRWLDLMEYCTVQYKRLDDGWDQWHSSSSMLLLLPCLRPRRDLSPRPAYGGCLL